MATKQQRKIFYRTITDQAKLEEAGGLAKERAVLLLWFLRNVVGVGDIDAYDFVCDGDDDKGIDGLFIEPSSGDEPDTLLVFQSKYTATPDGKVGDTDVDRLVGAATHFKSAETLRRLLAAGLEPSLRRLIGTLGLVGKLARSPESLRTRVVLVTSGLLTPDAKRKVENTRVEKGKSFVEVWTLDELGPLAESVRSPERMQRGILIDVTPTEILITGNEGSRVAILPVSALAIANWPGVDDRWLFALNVRHQLRTNRVSRGLDRAIAAPTDHKDFLAYHNGLTVICDGFKIKDDALAIRAPSVVNGAQSVLAFQRGLRNGMLTQELRIAVKIVEVAGRPVLEREVSRRSNTQTAVNPRNLMANSGPQLRLLKEFEVIPGITYETRPDQGYQRTDRVIKNDEAAQLLCAIYNQWPWLAVKRVSLFESDNHPHIFAHTISAHHIILADEIKLAVQGNKTRFPDAYRNSWLLTKLVACYLVGQIAREAADVVAPVLDDPRAALERENLEGILDRWARMAAAILVERNLGRGEADAFRADFKNESELKALGARARSYYRMARLAAQED